MKEAIQKYFKVGTILWMSYPPARYDQVEALKSLAKDDYFDVVEVTKAADERAREAYRDIIKQSHLKVCYGAQPALLGSGLNPNALSEEDRVKAEEVLMRAVDDAEYLGAKGIAFLSGRWSEDTKEEAYENLLKTTRNLCTYAKTKDMMIELEVFDYDMAKKSLIGPAPLAARFAADMRTTHDNFGLLVDLSHFPTTYEKSQFVIRTLRPYITHFHIGNAVVKEGYEAFGDEHPRFGFPDSANDTKELLEFFTVLKEEGFFDPKEPYVLSLEVKLWKDEDADIILANTKRVINRAWALVED